MNMIPMILILVAILSLASHSFLKEAKDVALNKEIALGYLRASRIYLSKEHAKGYKKAPKTALNKEQESPRENKRVFYREDTLPVFSLRFFANEESKALLEPLFLKTLVSVYGYHETFKELKDPKIGPALSGWILERTREQDPKKPLNISDLCPSNEKLRALFYKMIQGTWHYTPLTFGYPPFEELFSLDPSSLKKLTTFGHLPPFLLSVFFGEKMSHSIIQKEKELSADDKRQFLILSDVELRSLIHENSPSSSDLEKISQFFDFHTRKKKGKTLKAEDPTTHIVIKEP